MSTDGEIRNAAAPFAVCTAGWAGRGYGGNYTCLDREVDIANPEHETTDWWPWLEPCAGCELLRALSPITRGGTLPWDQKVALMREEDDRREYRRLAAKFTGGAMSTDGEGRE